MGVRARRLAVLGGGIALLGACSLVVDTAGLDDAAATGDAASPDARAADDASPIRDASTGSDAADAGTPCVDGPSRFCDDFDSPLPGSKWSGTKKKRGEVTFENVGVSPPRAMHAKLMAGTGTASAQLIKELAGNPPSVHCELDMKLEAIAATSETDVVSFITRVGGVDKHVVYFATFNGVWSLAEYAAAGDGGMPLVDRSVSLGAALPDATWFHVIMEVTPITATLAANGAFVTLGSLSTPVGSAHNVQVGVSYASESVQSSGVFIDNVDCRSLP